MRQFQLLAPIEDHTHVLTSQHSGLQKQILAHVGAYWSNGLRVLHQEAGQTRAYRDYRVVCGGPAFQSVLDAAVLLFPGELIYASDIGEAWLADR